MRYYPRYFIAWACILVSASCLSSTRRGQEHECSKSTLTDAQVREIGAAAIRSHFKDIPKPIEVRVARSGCNHAYMEIYDDRVIGDFVTVLISPDGKILGVAPGL